MDNYRPPFEISNRMLAYVSSITEKVTKLTYSNLLKTRPHLRKNNKIRSIQSSLAIEANSLSLSEVKDVINEKLVLGDKREIREVKNAYSAYDEIENIKPYSEDDLKRLHKIMTKYLCDDAGKFRKGEEGVFDGDKCIFMAPPAQLVPELIGNLFEWMNKENSEIHPLILSAVFHYEFVFVHPFSDGNGRMARLWHTTLLYNWNPIFEYIPIESQIEKNQEEYYKAISKGHIEGNSNYFIEFMLSQIDNALNEILNQVNSADVDNSEHTQKLLDAMEYGIQYSTQDLMMLLKLKGRSNFRDNYLLPSIKMGLVEMTIPQKPNSRNQKYIKVK